MIGGRFLRVGLAVGALVGGGLAPAVAAAQTSEEVLAVRRLEYRAARDAYEAARSAFSVVERDFSAALDAIERAKAGGDGDALERAYRLAQDRSVPMRAQEGRLAETGDALAEARRRLIDVITLRLGELLEDMDAVSSAAQRNRLDVLWRDLRNELEELEAEAGDRFALRPVILPEVGFDPRDGPEDLIAKAELLERRAARTDTIIQDVEGQIEALEDRIRAERRVSDFLAGTDRFDDMRAPGTPGRTPGGAEVLPADTTGAANRPRTLQERLADSRAYLLQLEAYRDQLLIRARQFRGQLRAIT